MWCWWENCFHFSLQRRYNYNWLAYWSTDSTMELTEKSGSVLTIVAGVEENTSSRLNIVDCANGKNNGASCKQQFDQNGHSASNSTGPGGGGHVSSDHPTSYGETLMHLLRGNIGAGVFGMGNAFKNGGLLLAPVLTITIGLISVHCQHVLVCFRMFNWFFSILIEFFYTLSQINCARRMRDIQNHQAEKTVNNEDPDFAETVELCFANGPPRLRRWSTFVKFLVNLFICVTQMGFCCIYFVFIAKNFSQVWFGANFLLPFPLGFIRHLFDLIADLGYLHRL